ncbi:MAG: membrane protein insertion efficiency factor YidD [Armatimonadia bacterium]
MAKALVWLIRLYQRFSRLLPPACRFRPTCSEYAIEAIQIHGVLKGVAMAAWRILRCNPFCHGGDDPVPPRRTKSGFQQ